MGAKQILNNVVSSNFKLKLSKVGTFYQSFFSNYKRHLYVRSGTSGTTLVPLKVPPAAGENVGLYTGYAD
jgi:hypothetical protein